MLNHENLDVYQKSHSLVLELYKVTKAFPSDERFGMVSHLRKTAFSVPSNIAEGCGRSGGRQLYNFMNIACGSLSELEAQLRIAFDLEYIDSDDYKRIKQLVIEVRKMAASYMSTLDQ